MSLPLLAAKLIELRSRYGYTQREVAAYLGLTQEGYNYYERNKREPNLEILMKLCKLYQIDIAELVNDKTVPIREQQMAELPQQKNGDCGEDSNITANIEHFLKIFSGKNAKADLTEITKEDISFLTEYKSLSKAAQKEVKEFVHFKIYIVKSQIK